MEPIKQIAGALPALYFMCVVCVSADDKRSGCTKEEMGHRCCRASGDVRETRVLQVGEEHGSLNRLLELLVVEGQEGSRTTRSANRKVSDDVACDLVILIQYLLAGPGRSDSYVWLLQSTVAKR